MMRFKQKRQSSNSLTKSSPPSSDRPPADVSRWEREIDRLVYQLYELTDEEIAIVEAASRKH
jgi:type II restriction/modification system DNA methylase subunit YeeA